MRPIVSTAALMALVSFGATKAQSQATTQHIDSQVESNVALRRGIENLPPRAHIRVVSAGVRTQGRFLGAVKDTIRIAAEASFVNFPFTKVNELSTRETRSGRMALVGSVFGALFLGTLASLIESSIDATFCEPFDCEKQDAASTTAMGIGIGGAVGGLAGFAIGRTMVRWKVRYP